MAPSPEQLPTYLDLDQSITQGLMTDEALSVLVLEPALEVPQAFDLETEEDERCD